MADFLKHLTIPELPTTYREDISASLALGISYIWIDSLCIIQDDEEDWTKEAALMKDVFKHCSVTLYATAAADSSQSNFRHRDPTDIPPVKVTLSDGAKKPTQSNFWLANAWSDLKSQDIGHSPLHSRAWVFQETKLSRRRIELVELILGSRIPKWPSNREIEELADELDHVYNFDEGQNVDSPIIRHPMVSYLEHPKGQADQRKIGIVDGMVRKSISFKKPDELSKHLRLFTLPILREEDWVGRQRVPCLLLCQTLDDFSAGNDVYQRVGRIYWLVEEDEPLEDLVTIPKRDVYII
ncbi:hypothetical protein SMACR_05934 [Sordaria macrospora]|uniref:WGS project CABT00000000 data, contig 2.24 n=2 Tax=Sordaria macrospora TaxID=5147 RepID=F7W3J4_SORMK|nr:uncharacterized protein SMAC_05934 [Sordaria macrospora k-hell]KAA8628811.1 hypothetical protein SMACR_05934 [Sordaria macrospora]WPJ65399.1 hypothetical protein SMAC4_05934 [Sordaria macrospora]CCC12196.1 unnamed protein product [Sordaria macrospora k-hell]